MSKSTIIEESTPVFDGDDKGSSTGGSTGGDSVDAWEEEKTILVFDDGDQVETCSLIDQENGDVIDIDHFPFSIGRNRNADHQIRHRSVSRQHAIIERKDDDASHVIKDVGSSNGVRVNGVKTAQVKLCNDDTIRFGDVEYVFQIENSIAATAQAENFDVDLDDDDDDILYAPSIATELDKQTGDDKADGPQEKDSGSSLNSKLAGFKEKLTNRYENISEDNKKKIPLIAAAGLGVLILGSYLLSPSRRVEIIDVPQPQAVTQTAENDISQQSQSSAPDPTASAAHAVQVDSSDASSGSEQSAATTTSSESVEQSSEALGQPGEISVDVSESASATADQTRVDTTLPESVLPEDVVAVETELKENTPPVETKPERKVIRRSPAWSRGYISTARQMYVDGDVQTSVKNLRILSRSSRHQQQFRDESRVMAEQIDQLYQEYVDGRALLDQGRDDEAFTKWRSFLLNESNLFPGQESTYARNIKSEVVNLYTSRGSQAYAQGQFHDAYNSWEQAAALAPNQEASGLLSDLKERAKKQFIEGYLQENISLQRATTLWREVMTMVPPGSEYHIKAKAKLRLYKNYGSQQ